MFAERTAALFCLLVNDMRPLFEKRISAPPATSDAPTT